MLTEAQLAAGFMFSLSPSRCPVVRPDVCSMPTSARRAALAVGQHTSRRPVISLCLVAYSSGASPYAVLSSWLLRGGQEADIQYSLPRSHVTILNVVSPLVVCSPPQPHADSLRLENCRLAVLPNNHQSSVCDPNRGADVH